MKTLALRKAAKAADLAYARAFERRLAQSDDNDRAAAIEAIAAEPEIVRLRERAAESRRRYREASDGPLRETQESVSAWADETFPLDADPRSSAVLLLKAAVEAALGSGLDRRDIRAAVEVPIRESERGGSGGGESAADGAAEALIALWALASRNGFDLQAEADRKMAANRARPASFHADKLNLAIGSGLPLRKRPKPETVERAIVEVVRERPGIHKGFLWFEVEQMGFDYERVCAAVEEMIRSGALVPMPHPGGLDLGKAAAAEGTSAGAPGTGE